MPHAETYIQATENDGSQWVSAQAFDEVFAALKALAALDRTPNEHARPETLAARAIIAAVAEAAEKYGP